MAKKKLLSCKGCGGKRHSDFSLCLKCRKSQVVVDQIGYDEDSDIVDYDEAMEIYREELGRMQNRDDDDGWAYADDPLERQSWEEICRDNRML